MSIAPGSHLPCARPAYSLCPMVLAEVCDSRRLIAAQQFTNAKYCASGQFVRCGAVGLVPLLAHSMPIMCQLPMLVGSHGYMPTPACHATPTATTVTVPSRAMWQLRQRARQIGTTVRDRGSAGVVGSSVVHHDAADVLEVAVAAVLPAGILDQLHALGDAAHRRSKQGRRPQIFVCAITRMVRRHSDTRLGIRRSRNLLLRRCLPEG